MENIILCFKNWNKKNRNIFFFCNNMIKINKMNIQTNIIVENIIQILFNNFFIVDFLTKKIQFFNHWIEGPTFKFRHCSPVVAQNEI
jgi:hypothetical protein